MRGSGRRSTSGGFFFQAEDGIRDWSVTGVQTCALPISYAVFCLRSKEQTSELKSLTNIVWRFLLEKKPESRTIGCNMSRARSDVSGRTDPRSRTRDSD